MKLKDFDTILTKETLPQFLAEFFGTLIICLIVVFDSYLGGFMFSTAFLIALSIGLFIYYTGGSLPMAYFNPVITLAILSLGKIRFKDAILFLSAQLFAGAIALLLNLWIFEYSGYDYERFWGGSPLLTGFGRSMSIMDVSKPLPAGWTDMLPWIGEILGTFFFSFAVAAVIYDRVPKKFTGIIVGGSLFLGIVLASALSYGYLNPMLAHADISLTKVYLIGPIIGALLGMWAFKLLSGEKS